MTQPIFRVGNQIQAGRCRKCKCTDTQAFGAGTQRVAASVSERIPDARVLRLDRDITAKPGAMEETLEQFRSGRANVLVGTQMVAKGHDFPNVTLVGVLLADASLSFPDFRAAERTFQLLTQVAGRAGRDQRPGRVLIQTFQPNHYAIECAVHHDVDNFYELESYARRSVGFPPFSRVGLVRIEAAQHDRAMSVCRQIRQILDARADSTARIRGPAPAPIPRLRDRHRFQILVTAQSPARLSQLMSHVRRELDKNRRGVDVLLDVDPTDLL